MSQQIPADEFYEFFKLTLEKLIYFLKPLYKLEQFHNTDNEDIKAINKEANIDFKEVKRAVWEKIQHEGLQVLSAEDMTQHTV